MTMLTSLLLQYILQLTNHSSVKVVRVGPLRVGQLLHNGSNGSDTIYSRMQHELLQNSATERKWLMAG